MAQLARLDGRLARSARTRRAVVDALLDLLGEGDLRPTAARIAQRAGVSMRLVFHHFDDLEAIYSELADRQAERVKPLTVPISAALPLPQRIEEFCAQRGRLLETSVARAPRRRVDGAVSAGVGAPPQACARSDAGRGDCRVRA